MPIGKEPPIARTSRVIYRGLLRFYSPEVRLKFGEEMIDVFVAMLREAVAEQRAVAIFSVWQSALWELLTVALPSRLASNAVRAGALSFLASAVLFLVFFRAVS
jgi:hypothetical protein